MFIIYVSKCVILIENTKLMNKLLMPDEILLQFINIFGINKNKIN